MATIAFKMVGGIVFGVVSTMSAIVIFCIAVQDTIEALVKDGIHKAMRDKESRR